MPRATHTSVAAHRASPATRGSLCRSQERWESETTRPRTSANILPLGRRCMDNAGRCYRRSFKVDTFRPGGLSENISTRWTRHSWVWAGTQWITHGCCNKREALWWMCEFVGTAWLDRLVPSLLHTAVDLVIFARFDFREDKSKNLAKLLL